MARPKKIGRKKSISKAQYRKNQIKNTIEWKKANTKSCNLTLHIQHDADILEHLSKQPNKQAYLRWLIREDIKFRNKVASVDVEHTEETAK